MTDVSVIVPLFNRVAIVGRAIESILAQDYPGEVEIIVVDDGSTDGAAEVIPKTFPQVHFLRQPNGGPASARNSGMARATGRYLAFLDSDDLYEPDKLSASIDLLERTPQAGFVFTDFSRFHVDQPETLFKFTNAHFYDRVYRYCRPWNRISEAAHLIASDRLFELLVRGYFMSSCTLVLRRSVAPRVGGWPEGRTLSEDFQFFLRLAQVADGIYIDRPLTRAGRGYHNLSADPRQCAQADIAVLEELARSAHQRPAFYRLVARGLSRRLNALARNYRMRGEASRARTTYRHALRHNPANIRAWLGYMRTLSPRPASGSRAGG